MKQALTWVKRNPVTAAAAFFVLCLALWYFGGSISQRWTSHQVSKENQKLETGINANQKAAETAEANANSAADARKAAEGRAQKALEEKQAAAVNSNRTLDPVRKARQRYEETRRSRPVDAPAITDDELCAELAKRGIACR